MDDLDRAYAEAEARLADAAAASDAEKAAAEKAGLAHHAANADRIAASLAADTDATG